MLAQQNVATLNNYGVKKIITTCPHCFNTLKNEYPALGGNYEVIHHSQYLQTLINDGKLKVEGGAFKGKRITYHDSCYLGTIQRGNSRLDDEIKIREFKSDSKIKAENSMIVDLIRNDLSKVSEIGSVKIFVLEDILCIHFRE